MNLKFTNILSKVSLQSIITKDWSSDQSFFAILVGGFNLSVTHNEKFFLYSWQKIDFP